MITQFMLTSLILASGRDPVKKIHLWFDLSMTTQNTISE